MLYSLALDHYYTNLKSNPLGIPFNKLYKAIYNYFKGLEYKRNILTQWNTIKLQTIINKHTEKSTIEYGLDITLRIDEFLCNKLIIAC
jgi:hypothetical protein